MPSDTGKTGSGPPRGGDTAVEIAVGRLRDLVEGPACLGEVMALGIAAVGPLEAFLRGPSESVFQPRCLAADALAAIGGKEAHEALARALGDSSGRELPAALRFSEDAVVNRIATHLGATADRHFAEPLLEALRAHPFGECARALGRLGERRAIPLLLECLRDDFAREGAMDALESLGEAAVPELTKLLTARTSQQASESGTAVAQRASAATVLGRIRESSEWPLLQALRDEHLEVRVAAALALCERGSGVRERTLKVLSEALDSESAFLAEAAARTLAGAGERAVARLLEVLREAPLTETDRKRRFASVHLLGRLGDPSAVDALRRMASDADALLRQAAAAALGRISDESSTKALAQFLDDPEPSVRRVAVLSLGARLDESSIRLLAPMLGDTAGKVRREAERALRKAGTDFVPAFRDALVRSLSAHDSLPRQWRIRRASRRLARIQKDS